MEHSNSLENFSDLVSIKKQFENELDSLKSSQSASYENDHPIKQEYNSYIKEEINIEWDDNDNYYGKDKDIKLLRNKNDKALKLDTKSICEPRTNTLQTQKKSKDKYFKTKKNRKKNSKECLFDKFCNKCKKTSTNIGNKCNTCQTPLFIECRICHRQLRKKHRITSSLRRKCCQLNYYYQCPECDYRSSIKITMALHVKRIHPLKGLNCADIGSWKKMCTDTEKNSLYKCSKCEKAFANYRSLNVHSQYCSKSMTDTHVVKKSSQAMDKKTQDLVSKNKKSVMKMTVYYCIECKRDTKIRDLKSRDQHCCHDCGSTLMFKCVKCKKQYKLYHSIVYHLKRVCDSQKTLQCSKCDYTAPLTALINKHYRMTHHLQICYCSGCGGEYKNPESLRKHLYNCSRKVYYKCNDCLFKTIMKSRLTSHIAKHLKNHK